MTWATSVGPRSPGVTLVDRDVSLTSRRPFRSAGLYALPGETVTVTRTDDAADVETQVFINTIRDGATHELEEHGYLRPKYLRGPGLSVAPGETLRLTTTYGGTIQVAFDANDVDVALTFENVGEHPYWNGPEDDDTFGDALEAGLFDWAELSTPAFEVHSTLENMIESASEPLWSSGSLLAAATMMYTYDYPHVVAGFRGDGISVESEIHDFAAANGWTIDRLEGVKHMNTDQATCGYGCSGNPYDAYWSFNPVGHGDLHELGHGLERGRFRLDGWEGHASTNPYSYYAKSRFHQNTGEDPDCQNLPFEELYGHLQTAAATDDPTGAMADLHLGTWGVSVGTTIQMMAAVQAEGVLEDGWHLWARLHVYEREFRRVLDNEETFAAGGDSLGLAGMAYGDANALNNNDWMLIALSFVGERDFSAFFDLYGLAYSQAAHDHVAGWSYSLLPVAFYALDGSDFCYGLDVGTLPIDGVTPWPAE